MFKKSVVVVEVLAVIAAALFVIALFTNGSGLSAATPSGYGSKREAPRSGAEIYQMSSAVCHGDEGQGGQGPQLADGAVVEAYPDEADQIVVVTEGKNGRMPPFNGTLSTQEIEAVVAYTRKDLG